jgi:hypothetical protein
MPATNVLPDANVRSLSYHVARVLSQCPNCGSPTRLLALALPRGHETLDIEMSDGLAPGAWQDIDAHAILFYIEQISNDVRRRLQVLSAHFRFAQSTVTHSSYWANHCEHCGALLEDHELHCEPDGPFSPASEAAAANIELVKIDEPLEAAAAGYTQEPEFFGSMRSA